MAKPRESSKAAIVVVVLLLIPLLIGGGYVGGYYVCSGSTPWHDEPIFYNEWQFEFYRPLVQLERWLTGREILTGHAGP
jgi:hypothetical protein